jgi:hypothetical protein
MGKICNYSLYTSIRAAVESLTPDTLDKVIQLEFLRDVYRATDGALSKASSLKQTRDVPCPSVLCFTAVSPVAFLQYTNEMLSNILNVPVLHGM